MSFETTLDIPVGSKSFQSSPKPTAPVLAWPAPREQTPSAPRVSPRALAPVSSTLWQRPGGGSTPGGTSGSSPSQASAQLLAAPPKPAGSHRSPRTAAGSDTLTRASTDGVLTIPKKEKKEKPPRTTSDVLLAKEKKEKRDKKEKKSHRTERSHRRKKEAAATSPPVPVGALAVEAAAPTDVLAHHTSPAASSPPSTGTADLSTSPLAADSASGSVITSAPPTTIESTLEVDSHTNASASTLVHTNAATSGITSSATVAATATISIADTNTATGTPPSVADVPVGDELSRVIPISSIGPTAESASIAPLDAHAAPLVSAPPAAEPLATSAWAEPQQHQLLVRELSPARARAPAAGTAVGLPALMSGHRSGAH